MEAQLKIWFTPSDGEPLINSRRGGALFLLVNLLLSACSTSSRSSSSDTIGMDEFDQRNQAHGAAYVVDSMQVRRPMPGHKDWKPLEFYYKHCTDLGEENYYSKTSYSCTDPF